MQFLFDILPVFLFFIAFKFINLYVATLVGMGATLIQTLATRAITKKWDQQQVITLVVFVLFGGLTLYFHNPIFVKWKPTIIFWLFALIIILKQLLTGKSLIQSMMTGAVEGRKQLPARSWRVLNRIWAGFFAILGLINLYIAYNFSDAAWVNFKFYGITIALFLFCIMQAFYIASVSR